MRAETLRWIPILLSLAAVAAPAAAQDGGAPPAEAATAAPAGDAPEPPDPDPWPRQFEADGHQIRVFPPQLESWDGTRLAAQVAVEVIEQTKRNPMYGVFRFTARTRTDKEARLVVIDEMLGVSASFPSRPKAEPRLLALLDRRLREAVKVVSLDRLEASLATLERAERPAAVVRNEPPEFLFAERPTLLVLVDGEPAWRPIADTPFARLLNTRPLLLRSGDSFYLHLFDGWLAAPNLAGPWKVPFGTPKGLAEAASKSLSTQPADLLDGGGAKEVDADGAPIDRPTLARGPVPDVVVALEPTELVVFDGAPRWQAITGTSLEFVENTSGNLFRSGSPARHWLLASGRWFGAPALAGPWSFVGQGQLPPDFAAIPDESPKENVKAAVAGTAQAREAVIANSIPQTAEIRRAGAEFSSTIDGEPSLAAIAGTELAYVENSPTPILRVAADRWFALHDGVWFTARALAGPWTVADRVPDAIYAIPASSPLHYVTYVRVYDADEEVVVVGYTPGYYGTVEVDGTVVCGTGYAYDPWLGSAWYGYPATYGYGCGITYTPWDGWAFTFGVGWAWGYWGGWYGPYYPPYWGPYWGYYGGYGGAVVGPGGGWAAWGPGGWAGSTGNIYRHWGSVSTVSRYSGGFDAWSGTAWRSQVGAAYNSRTGTIAAGQRGAVGNIYTGRYAYGGRGVASGPGGGTVAGGRVTTGEIGSGRDVTAGRVGGYDPATGQGGSAGWVRGDQGGVARVGDDYYGWNDGSVYKRDGQGDWSQVERSGDWSSVSDRERAQQLDSQYRARSSGSQRYSGYRSSAPRGGGGMRGGGGRRR